MLCRKLITSKMTNIRKDFFPTVTLFKTKHCVSEAMWFPSADETTNPNDLIGQNKDIIINYTRRTTI